MPKGIGYGGHKSGSKRPMSPPRDPIKEGPRANPARGRSANAPGQIKKVAGVQSAKTFAPGAANRPAGVAKPAPSPVRPVIGPTPGSGPSIMPVAPRYQAMLGDAALRKPTMKRSMRR